MPAVRIYAAMSLDGFIADSSGAVDWLDRFPARKYGFDAFLASVGAVVMGRSTFEQVTTFGDDWPYPDKKSVILSSRKLDRLPPGAHHERAGIRPAIAMARWYWRQRSARCRASCAWWIACRCAVRPHTWCDWSRACRAA